ncbi:MAG TPA: glutaredoxin family protein [Pyrinomonadaceae bacterium]|nr:glutaredoxin family protein [Pyrinomonadaceae bacterium]
MSSVKVYGADWCEDTRIAREHLESLGVDYEYINVEEDEEASRWVREQNEGRERKPTIKVGGQVLSTPSAEELDDALRSNGVLSL